MSDDPVTPQVTADEVREARTRQSQSAPAPLVKPCTACWIEVWLLDEDDRGVANEPYWIRLPDGQVREGRLDERGSVRFDGIPCGMCLVRLPGMDEREVLAKTSLPAEKTDWIEIVLLDEENSPVAGEPYTIDLPDGRTLEGNLDAGGRARVEGIPSGTCVVRFPEVDAGDFLER
jgi:uncharacterized protein (DUF2345 family)